MLGMHVFWSSFSCTLPCRTDLLFDARAAMQRGQLVVSSSMIALAACTSTQVITPHVAHMSSWRCSSTGKRKECWNVYDPRNKHQSVRTRTSPQWHSEIRGGFVVICAKTPQEGIRPCCPESYPCQGSLQGVLTNARRWVLVGGSHRL